MARRNGSTAVLQLSLLAILASATAALAGSDPIFRDDFEWGDTGDWSATAPARCDVIAPFDRGSTPTGEIHVAPPPAGSDTNGDGSPGSPFATLAHAATFATPGTAIRLHPGTYAGGSHLGDLHGTAGAPIWIGGLPGAERPVFAGGSQAFQLSRARYVVVHDLELRDATANGINADDGGDVGDPLASHHLAFRRLAIHDIGSGGNDDGLKLSGIRDFWVTDSTFARCGDAASGSGVDCVGCHRGLIARNRFEQTSGNAVQAKGGSTDVEMRWNHLVDPGARGFNLGGSTGYAYFRPPLSTSTPNAEARNLRAVGNVIEGSGAAIAFVGCVDCVAANNTIVDSETWLLRILQETVSGGGYVFAPASGGLVIDNLFLFQDGPLSTHVNIGPDTAPATFQFANNLWYASDAPGSSQPSLPSPETGGVYGEDPRLLAGFRIDTSSPAAGAGAARAWLAGDRDGFCYAAPRAIGAYEAY
jgi:hypothetical protein